MAHNKRGLNKVHVNQTREPIMRAGNSRFGRTLVVPYVQAVLADSPIGYWRLDDKAPFQALDSSSFTRHMSIRGPITREVTGPLTGSGFGMTFPATITSFIGGSLGGQSAMSAISCDMWVKTASLPAGGRWPFTYVQSGGTSLLAVGFTNSPTALVTVNAQTQQTLTMTSSIADDAWHYIALTWETVSEALSLYVDGALMVTGTNPSSTTIPTTTGHLVIGQEQDSQGGSFDAAQAWSGSIAEVAIYPSQLSLERVQAHYAAASLPPYIS